jgi:prolyl-tRNA editing enzyme YbaK/EbsC (Cys-tRNA(Pro) deacylase)
MQNISFQRVIAAMESAGLEPRIQILSESARTAGEAAAALHIEVGQIASSIVFRLPDGNPLLIITSGRHRVDTDLVARTLDVEALQRADAEFVRTWSGYAIGGVSPLGWLQPATVLIDEALREYEVVWAAAGHPHAVFATSFHELISATGARPILVTNN